MIPVSLRQSRSETGYSRTVRSAVALTVVVVFHFAWLPLTLVAASTVYVVMEGYRVMSIAQAEDVPPRSLLGNGPTAILRRVEIWGLIVLTVGYTALISGMLWSGIPTVMFLYIGGIFTQVTRRYSSGERKYSGIGSDLEL